MSFWQSLKNNNNIKFIKDGEYRLSSCWLVFGAEWMRGISGENLLYKKGEREKRCIYDCRVIRCFGESFSRQREGMNFSVDRFWVDFFIYCSNGVGIISADEIAERVINMIAFMIAICGCVCEAHVLVDSG